MKNKLPIFPYNHTEIFKFQLKGRRIEVASKPGLPDWNQLSAASVLIGEMIALQSSAQVLYLGCGNGAGATSISYQLTGGKLWLHDFNFIATQMSLETIQQNRISNAQLLYDINLPVELENYFDVVIIELPKGRKLAQRWLVTAFIGLRAGGVLYLCGANRHGINPSVKDAEMLFGDSVVQGYKKGNRLVRFTKIQLELPPSGWWCHPGIAPTTWYEHTLHTTSKTFTMFSLPGIFSFDRLDEGTQLLLENLPNLHNMNVLDLGCGYGAIGLVAANSGVATIDLLDVSLLAVAAAKKNITHHKITDARVLASDVLSEVPGKKYNLILSNPPFHTGRDVDYFTANAFIEQSFLALDHGGRLYIVANRFIRYEKIMGMFFQQIKEVVQSPRYHILCGMKE